MEPMRLLVTDAAAQPPRQATAWLIMTLGRRNPYSSPTEKMNAWLILSLIWALMGTALLIGWISINIEFSAPWTYGLGLPIGAVFAFAMAVLAYRVAKPKKRN
jgi:hypothetical protein